MSAPEISAGGTPENPPATKQTSSAPSAAPAAKAAAEETTTFRLFTFGKHPGLANALRVKLKVGKSDEELDREFKTADLEKALADLQADPEEGS